MRVWFPLLMTAVSSAISHSQDLLLIGTYTSTIFRYSLDRNGTLERLGQSVVDQNPSWITLSSDGRFLFAVDEIEDFGGVYCGAVSSYEVQDDFSLIFLSR